MKRVVPIIIIGLLSLTLYTHAAVEQPKHKYVGVKKCRKCHRKKKQGEQYRIWKESAHAKAFLDLSLENEKARESAKKKGIEGDPQKAPECLKCHVTAYGVDKKWIAVDKKTGKPSIRMEDGVQCESCHGPGADYRKKKIMRKILKERLTSKNNVSKTAEEKGLIIPTEETCTKCHNEESPNWDPNKYTTKEGKKVGFYFEEAKEKIKHPIPEERKQKVLKGEK